MPTETESPRDQLISALAAENIYGVLLVAQVGGVPNELQLIIETAEYDESAQGLRPRANYIIRVLGVLEHRLTLGVFGRLLFTDDHPLLYHHNAPKVAVHFDGKPANINELVLDISQAYASTFGPWRHIAEMGDDINRALPLVDLLATGYGLLGTMPRPLAERMARVLEHHKLRATLAAEANFPTDSQGRARQATCLLLDESYCIALDFSVEQMGGLGRPKDQR
ncbi:MAG: hypothetical protein GYB67_05000 [Chloroflexi bacterium]|nr:hypothetical protein [Chloroflexota bacterium]